jgi:hypothetical protein
MITALFSVLFLATDTPPAAVDVTSAPTATAEAPKAERTICKREPIPSSQYRTKRVCKTAAEWKAHARGQGIEDLSDVTTK